jgi:hypothetical protein
MHDEPPAEDLRVATKVALPRAVTEDDDRRRTLNVVFRPDCAAE